MDSGTPFDHSSTLVPHICTALCLLCQVVSGKKKSEAEEKRRAAKQVLWRNRETDMVRKRCAENVDDKKPRIKDREKVKRMKGQSSHPDWKSETYMKLRQQFD